MNQTFEMFTIWNFLFQILPIIAILTFLARRRYQYWQGKGLSGPTPVFPIGYFWQRIRVCPKKLELDWFKKYGKIYGVYMGWKPVLTISDAKLIKQILVKDFHLFVNRRDLQSYHHIWSKNLFFAEQNDWKRVRSIASPAFTTGKLRRMYSKVQDSIGKLKSYLNDVTKKEGTILDIKETMVGFTLDVIASTSFGMDTNSNSDRTNKNPFNYYGQKFFQPSNFDTVATAVFPRWVLKILNIPHQFPRDSFNFFTNVSKKIIENKNGKQTLVGLLQEASVNEDDLKNINWDKLTATGEHQADSSVEVKQENSSTQKFLTEDEIIAQCILFFNAGFETTSSALSNALFQLAKNPDIQERLYNEIDQLFQEYENEELTVFYDKIMSELPFLGAVIKETLRMYPTVYRLERRVSVDGYQLGGIELDKDTLVEISTVSVHYDPEYYVEPHKFNPDRFMPENRDKLTPYTYLPFGDGPRNCIGMRFALQELRFGLSHLVKNFRFEKCSSTPNEPEFIIGCPILLAKPFPLRVFSRQ